MTSSVATSVPHAKPVLGLTRKKLLIGLALLIGGGLFASSDMRNVLLSPLSSFFAVSEEDYDYLVTETVQLKSFQVTVTEQGTLDSLKNASLNSMVEGKTSIIWIIPEGTHVQEGDLVCELDSSALIDKETTQRINVTQADAALLTAEREVEIQKTINESNIEAAELAHDLAKIDLRKYQDGDLEQQKMELQSLVKVSRENLSRAKEYLNYLERLVRKGYKMQSDLDAERIAYAKTETDMKVTERKLDVLVTYTKERTERELVAKVEETRRQIDRAKSQASASMAQKEADFEAKKLSHEVQSSYLKRTQNQIQHCKITATQDGQVVYANTRNGRSAEQVLIEVGSSVNERQPIINLPDLDAMKVNARIHESRVGLVHPGQTVTIKVDAVPAETFYGVVDSVASVPSSLNSFNRDLKEYETIIRMTDEVEKLNQLRPGMTATVEILISQRDDVLQSPVQSLVTVGEQRYVYVLGPHGPRVQEVKIGETNDRTMEILEGLDDGDRVIMNPRSHFSKEISELEAQYAKEHAHDSANAQAKSDAAKSDASKTDAAKAEAANKPKEQGPPKASNPNSPAGNGPPAGPTGSPGDSEQRTRMDPLARFQSMDQNKDGKLSEEELNERIRPRFSDMDTDHNGSVDQQEFTTFASQFRGRNGGNGGG